MQFPDQFFEFFLVSGLTFPNYPDTPSLLNQHGALVPIPFTIGFYFSNPEIRSG